MNAGVIYEILMYLNSFYFGLYASFKICVSILKPIFLPYEENTWIREAVILLALCIVETIRSVLGRRSSLSDRGWHAIVSLILTLPSLAIVIYMYSFCMYIHLHHVSPSGVHLALGFMVRSSTAILLSWTIYLRSLATTTAASAKAVIKQSVTP